MILHQKRLVFSPVWTFKHKTGFLFTVNEFRSRIVWSLDCAQINSFMFVFPFNLRICLYYGWSWLMTILGRALIQTLILNFCHFCVLLIPVFLAPVELDFCFGYLYIFFFCWLVILISHHTAWTWFDESLRI